MARAIFFALLATLSVGTASAQAQDRDKIVKTPELEMQLISAVTATGDRTDLPLGLKVRLTEGWKIYWRSPGDAGLPPELSLADENANSQHKLEMDFPIPSRFSLLGLDTYGYGKEVIFPVYLRGHDAGQPLRLEAEASALVCADICIPVGGSLSLDIPAGQSRASTDAQDIARYAALVPKDQTGPDIGLEKLAFISDPPRLMLEMKSGTPPVIDVFIETPVQGLGFAQPVAQSPQLYAIAITGPGNISALAGQQAVLTIKTDSQFREIVSIIPRLSSAPSGSWISASLLFILLAAFAGGVILNIMPCVLPVLSLKLASILSMGGASPAQIRTRLMAGAAGILTSFALLGLVLVGLKLAGGRLGWGIQFQNPWFLGVMMLIMALFTLSLLDIVRFPIPAFAGRIGAGGLLGDFAAGFMATILATPCSAPLVGTAVSFALAASAPQLFLVMLVMGTGLALPWLILAAFPHWIAAMPAPGAWMKWVKPLLASGLVATILWLGWLLAGASGILASDNKIAGGNGTPAWQPWQLSSIETHLANGQPVFVDVTADWCITCKVNKALVLNSGDIRAAFEAKNTVMLQADWTLPDSEIADYLASFGRFGIPFNILYYPDGRPPVIFDELLTKEKIVSALDKLN
ncbi:MAG: protein-disulfide reductase DsbD family protein [Candidatus Puniceispirillaceae bacterium]